MKNLSKKYYIFGILLLGAGLTQFYQNCAPLANPEGFLSMSSSSDMETGVGNHPILGAEKI